jgi:hypothetical protein
VTQSTDIDTATIAMSLRQRELRNQNMMLDLQRRAQNAAADGRRRERKHQAEAADHELQAKAIEKRKAEENRRLIEQFGSSGGRGGSRGW